MHYVSTCPVSPLENSTDIEHEKLGEHIHLSPKSKRQNNAAYMREYRKATLLRKEQSSMKTKESVEQL